MLGVKVAVISPAAPHNNVYVHMQIKNDDDNEELRLAKLQDDELLQVVKYNKHGLSGGYIVPFKDSHDRFQSHHALDHGVSLYKGRVGQITAEEMCSVDRPRSPSPRSRAKLQSNHPVIEENRLFNDIGRRLNFNDLSVLELKAALENSESHCSTLKHKLREAQNALVLQGERLQNIESAAMDNSVLVDDLKFKEMEYRKVIDNFEVSVKEKQQLQLQNLRLREDIQDRVDALDHQLRTHNKELHSKECKHHHNTCLHITGCDLHLLEQANKKLDLVNKELSAELASVRSCYLLTLQQAAAVEQSKSVWQSQQQLAEQQRSWLQSEIDRLSQENKNIKQAIENSFTKTDYEKLQDDHRKLQTEHDSLNHEYNLLNYKHQDYIISHKKEKEAAEKENQEMILLKKEKESLVKQVTMLQDKLSQVEESKKQAEGQIGKLKTELAEVNAIIKQNSSSRENVLEEKRSLIQEVEKLKQQIEKAKEKELVQEKKLTSLKKEHLENTNSELENLRSKLQELMGEAKNKEQIIEKLKFQIKSSDELVQAKECEIQELLKTIKNLEEEKHALLEDVQMLRDLLEAELSQKQEQLTLKRSQSAKSLQEELSKADRSDMYGSYDQSRSHELRCASVPPMEPGKTQQKGRYGGWFFVLPENSEAEGGNRLQNLVSKYRSHSESEMESQQLAGKPLTGNVSPNLLSRSRFSDASQKTSMDTNYTSSPTEAHRSLPAIQERGSSKSMKYSRSATNPLSSTVREFPSTKSSFMQTASSEDAKKGTTSIPSTTSMSSSVRRILPSVVSGKTNSG